MSDGRTVWVNHPTGCSAARFGLRGIDVHKVPTGDCLFCTHEWTTRQDWDLFVVKVREAFGIHVDARHMPTRLMV